MTLLLKKRPAGRPRKSGRASTDLFAWAEAQHAEEFALDGAEADALRNELRLWAAQRLSNGLASWTEGELIELFAERATWANPWACLQWVRRALGSRKGKLAWLNRLDRLTPQDLQDPARLALAAASIPPANRIAYGRRAA